MQLSRGEKILNALSWIAIVGLVILALLIADVLGFAGLICLGLFTALICTTAELDQDVPTGSAVVFRARTQPPGSPEERSARAHERHTFTTALRFGKRCGLALLAIGATGFTWQQWFR